MNGESRIPQYVIVLGTTYSGSGAVLDYLSGRGDLYDPMSGAEYLLPQAPNGLMALEAAAGQAFHHATSDHAATRFLDLARKLSRPSTRIQYGKGYADRIPEFFSIVEQFKADVTAAHMPMQMDWRSVEQRSSRRLFNKLKGRFGIHEPCVPTHILVSSDHLVAAAQAMHDRVFRPTSRSQPVLLNQAGSGWNPVLSTKYFKRRKVVLVTRDPRDQFAELKSFKKARDVGEFVKWYRQLQHRIANVNDSLVLKVTFEEFVLNNDASVELICRHLGLSPDVRTSYEPTHSEINIGKYRKCLTEHETRMIEENLFE